VNHTASARFRRCCESLPADFHAVADKDFELLKRDPAHPPLQFKLLGGGKLYSVRVGLHYLALGLPRAGGVHWFWIGSHAEVDRLVDA
jgi:hypothetical protein